MKLVKGIAIGGIVFLIGRFIYNLKRAENKTAIELGGRVHKLTTQGVELHIDYNIKNPSASNMEMAIPLIKLNYKGANIASSSLTPFITNTNTALTSANRIRINQFSETGTITAKILVSYLSMAGLGLDLFKVLEDRLNGGDKAVELEYEVNTTIFTNAVNLPYDDKQTIKI
ncbi:MAG: hypothetical protein Crog4KO_25920 [Crocinitomicaceae bacterium]